MDPNITRRNILDNARVIQKHREACDADEAATDPHTYAQEAETLAADVLALDEWLCSGGFLPEDWTTGGMTLMRKVKHDANNFKSLTVSVAQYGAYVEIWWPKGTDYPRIECNFFDGSAMDAHKATTLATLLKIGAGIAKSWLNDPPWDRSIK